MNLIIITRLSDSRTSTLAFAETFVKLGMGMHAEFATMRYGQCIPSTRKAREFLLTRCDKFNEKENNIEIQVRAHQSVISFLGYIILKKFNFLMHCFRNQ